MSRPDTPRYGREDALALGVLFVAIVAVYVPVLYAQVLGREPFFPDFVQHIGFAKRMAANGLAPQTPHFLYGLLLVLCVKMWPRLGYYWGSVAVVLAAYLVLGAVLYAVFRPAWRGLSRHATAAASAAVALATMLAAPINIGFPAHGKALYNGFVALAAYHNPTVVLVRPLSVVLLLLAARFVAGAEAPRPLLVLAAAAMTILSTLTKPSFIICLLPALAFFAPIWLGRRLFSRAGALALGFFLPGGALLGWQFVATYGDRQVLSQPSRLILAPLEVMSLSGAPGELALKLLLSVAFPLFVLLSCPRAARRDAAVGLALPTCLVGLSFVYLLAESGERLPHGNFLWSGQLALFVLLVITLRLFLAEAGEGGRRRPVLAWGGTILLGLHLVSGVRFYIQNLSQ